MSADCLFCKIITGDIPADVVHRDAHVLAFRDIDPKAPTHILVIPLEHTPNAASLAAADPAAVGELVQAAGRIAADEGIVEPGYRMVFNTGDDAGQTVHHTHLHLLGGRPFDWPPG
ncbi:histidine triad nucleotide-binding protein [Nakamurella lactea]|uniref:histidine triad nucleotide-binding protein n=1 Tax=Nakamurella lactea TaxID=459515 RepID=UPI0004124834|nr:histidine triad nucleotide-binding protein [Nakamurella lactea]